jgi:hypothetical protein
MFMFSDLFCFIINSILQVEVGRNACPAYANGVFFDAQLLILTALPPPVICPLSSMVSKATVSPDQDMTLHQ